MKIRVAAAVAWLALPVAAQQRPGAKPHDMSNMQHGGFMQEGMRHATAKGVKLAVETEATTHTVTLRIGPMDLPANTSHMRMAQPPELTWTIADAAWLLGYRARLVDASDAAVPGVVLHHVAFWNENRPDFLCPNKDEHIFGAGGELTDWAPVPGFGYRVEKGDRIRIETMMHNPTAKAYPKVYLQVAIPYADGALTAYCSESADICMITRRNSFSRILAARTRWRSSWRKPARRASSSASRWSFSTRNTRRREAIRCGEETCLRYGRPTRTVRDGCCAMERWESS
jgi:hypothetical protein